MISRRPKWPLILMVVAFGELMSIERRLLGEALADHAVFLRHLSPRRLRWRRFTGQHCPAYRNFREHQWPTPFRSVKECFHGEEPFRPLICRIGQAMDVSPGIKQCSQNAAIG